MGGTTVWATRRLLPGRQLNSPDIKHMHIDNHINISTTL